MDISTVVLILVAGVGAIAAGLDYESSARRPRPLPVRANRR